ncbi:hypothetical protein FB192DRAFT_1352738 [Mucor lusitanicus]|uniref:Uncharacterized protein n=1 Tax=Mucor circinelloides f. lusitanicus TaxID=29924 RepID=A0A8H4BRT2_MUCCL|nr:hypothetical protein FB192DRAFT_1352738 [Mucor lusitanicus]
MKLMLLMMMVMLLLLLLLLLWLIWMDVSLWMDCNVDGWMDSNHRIARHVNFTRNSSTHRHSHSLTDSYTLSKTSLVY